LALGTYSIHAFHAPSGRAGRVDGLRILTAGQTVSGQILLDTRGRIGGTLWDDAARTVGVAGGTVQILGNVNGRSWGTSIRALATTASGATPGAFLFDGLPVGTYAVDATAPASPRRAATSVALTPTSPTAELALVLEPTASRSVRVFENRTAPPHLFELDTTSAIVSVRLSQPPGCPSPGFPCSFDVSLLGPTSPFPNHLFTFDGVLSSRPLRVTVSEVGGEQRTATAQGAQLVGAGTASDPYRLVLTAEGAVRVTVRDGGGALVSGANVYVNAPGGPYGSATNAAGVATFTGVPAGAHTATAQTSSGLGGLTSFTLTYDDEVADVTVTLEAAVSAQGMVFAAPVGDVDDPGTRVPQAGAIVRITDAGNRTQVMSSRADGSYRFDALRIGAFSVAAELAAEDGSLAIASAGGTLSGPNGTLNALAPLVLDAAAPRIVSVSPPPGQTSVSRLAIVEILFSEALHPSVTAALPTFFRVLAPGGSQAPGAFVSSLDATGRAVVRFTPSALYENRAVYAIVVVGGPGGVRDRAGRQLTSSGDVGSSFTTSDTVGPQIVATSPALDRPVSPQAELAFDFNEPVSGTAAELDGDGVNDAAVLEYGRADGGGGVLFTPIPSTMFLTRGGYTFVVRQPQGLSLAGDNGRRRITISRLRDSQGNAMQTDVRTFVHFDTNPPAVQLVNPP
ncbi:MAG: Ig-like domain-containing protein, partial [Acidobacteria bacterium]|nr:Ig-like domain-containing protein [Acidobacteriota bacterium]